MIVHAFGHACVGLESESSPRPNLRILWDPFEPGSFGGAFAYPPINFDPHLILLSHPHADHSYTTPFQNTPVLSLSTTPETITHTFSGSDGSSDSTITIRTLKTWHDAYEGTTRGGANWLSLLTFDSLRVLHTGDLGELPEQDVLDSFLGEAPVDVLFLSCGGFYTLGPSEAHEIARRVRARLIFPMHVRTSLGTLSQLAPVDAFKVRFHTVHTHTASSIMLPTSPHDAFFSAHHVIVLPLLAV